MNHSRSKQLKVLILAVLFSGVLLQAPPARSQFAVIDVSLNLQQLEAFLEQVIQYEVQAQQLEQAILQYENMVKNSLDLNGAVWVNIGGLLNGINSVIANGQSIANRAQNINQAFTTMFPTVQSMRGSLITNAAYQTSYQTWSNNSRAGVQTNLSNAQVLLNARTQDQSTLISLQSQAQGASGNLQAVKAAAAVASEEVVQLQQLKLLLAQDVATQGQVIAEAQAERAMHEAASAQALAGSTPPYGSGKTY
jgi:P-type conjugative transfer protein TrbJ